jgi:hypothetical protein
LLLAGSILGEPLAAKPAAPSNAALSGKIVDLEAKVQILEDTSVAICSNRQ